MLSTGPRKAIVTATCARNVGQLTYFHSQNVWLRYVLERLRKLLAGLKGDLVIMRDTWT